MRKRNESQRYVIPLHRSMEDWLRNVEQIADEPVLLAPGRPPLSYGNFVQQIEYVRGFLNQHSVGRNDRVAVVLPNGPELVMTFMAVISCASFAPLNPNHQEKEDHFYLRNLNAKAMITLADLDSPARRAARSWGIPVFELTPLPDKEAGLFQLLGNHAGGACRTGFSAPDDVAVLLHTSGTTAQPKLVPLTQKNIFSSAHHVGRSLQLTPDDCCLNVMPLFHIHGLIGAVLASLNAYSTVVSAPDFRVDSFFSWVEEFRPSWYTAVPGIHQSVLQLAEQNPQSAESSSFRLIRSSSTSLAPQVMKRLEMLFDVPVIEAYGMTECAHQVSSNMLPPGARKPGSVGIAVGSHIETMDASGNILPRGETGELVIKGPGVMTEYEHNPKATHETFTDGWLRTGDEGMIDADGYIFITGRSKEQINQAGFKIAPREIDEVLLDHYAVDQAVTFGIPHFRLGEVIASAVVLKKDHQVGECELKSFLMELLAPYKIPRLILILDRLPGDATGKSLRIGLYKELSSHITPEYTPPETHTEIQLASIWSSILGIERIGRFDNFFILGGDSILATQSLDMIKTELHATVEMEDIYFAPTLSELAQIIEQAQKSKPAGGS